MIKTIWYQFLSLLLALSACNAYSSPFVVIEFPQLKTNIFIAETESVTAIKFVEASDPPIIENKRRAILRGSGVVVTREVRIQYNNGQILVNNKAIPVAGEHVLNYVLTTDGKIQPGFLRGFE